MSFVRGAYGLILVAVTAAACSNTKSSAAGAEVPEAARQVNTVRVTQQALTRMITVTGTLAAEEQVALSFKVAGRVDRVTVDLGSVVRQGQVLAALVPTDFELRVRQ